MIMNYLMILCGFCLLLAVDVQAGVKGEEIRYQVAGVEMHGYLAYDDSTAGKRPAIVVVHEWWGHNEYARKRARMLAELGYAALAIDMYGSGRQADHPGDAREYSNAVWADMPAAKQRFEASLLLLQNKPFVDSSRIAAIGYCFGGRVVLEMARMGLDLDGVASFHGSLATDTPAKPGTVKAKILVANGADDGFVPPEQIVGFKTEMESAGVSYRFVNYPSAKHSFTNPDADEFARKFNLDLAYSAAADAKSWQDLQDFLAEIFKK